MTENYLKKELYDLIQSEQLIFEFIQSGSLDGIWYWDLEQPENEWLSPKFWETLGYNPEEKKHLSSEWQDIINQEDLKLATENFHKHCENPNHPYDQIVRYEHKDGSTVWIRCRGLAIRDESGKAKRMLGAHTDITDLKNIENELSRLTTEYEKVFNGTQDAMFLMKLLPNNRFLYVRNNLAHQNKTGLKLEDIRDKMPEELLGEEVGQIVSENYQTCVNKRTSITYEEELDLPVGRRLWRTTLTPIFEEETVINIVGSSTDITEQKLLERELEKQANYDKLTDLPNRKLFFERLERMITETERDQKQFALLFVDLDGFKHINDQYGHRAGDDVLITVGKRLTESVRKSDTVARMGGDEFTIILRDTHDRDSLEEIVKKIHQRVKEAMRFGDCVCHVDSSVGIAIYPDDGLDSETLLKNADEMMYKIKYSGKGSYGFFSDFE
ncbi:MAG: diguanylate cyclase domain-containing protein [Bacillota bacterium]